MAPSLHVPQHALVGSYCVYHVFIHKMQMLSARVYRRKEEDNELLSSEGVVGYLLGTRKVLVGRQAALFHMIKSVTGFPGTEEGAVVRGQKGV